MTTQLGLGIGSVVFQQGGARLEVLGAARVRLLRLAYLRLPLPEGVALWADGYSGNHAITHEDVNWDSSGIPTEVATGPLTEEEAWLRARAHPVGAAGYPVDALPPPTAAERAWMTAARETLPLHDPDRATSVPNYRQPAAPDTTRLSQSGPRCSHVVTDPYCGQGCVGFGQVWYDRGWLFLDGAWRPPLTEP